MMKKYREPLISFLEEVRKVLILKYSQFKEIDELINILKYKNHLEPKSYFEIVISNGLGVYYYFRHVSTMMELEKRVISPNYDIDRDIYLTFDSKIERVTNDIGNSTVWYDEVSTLISYYDTEDFDIRIKFNRKW